MITPKQIHLKTPLKYYSEGILYFNKEAKFFYSPNDFLTTFAFRVFWHKVIHPMDYKDKKKSQNYNINISLEFFFKLLYDFTKMKFEVDVVSWFMLS